MGMLTFHFLWHSFCASYRALFNLATGWNCLFGGPSFSTLGNGAFRKEPPNLCLCPEIDLVRNALDKSVSLRWGKRDPFNSFMAFAWPSLA